jgi:hypothetical protein
MTSLYLVYKNPDDNSVKLFFIYLQAFAICQNAMYLSFSDPLAIAATFIFWLCTCLIGPLLIYFHLMFPRNAIIYNQFKKLPLLFYLIGLIFFIVCLITYIPLVHGWYYLLDFGLIKRIALSWLTLTYLVAVAIVIYQFVTIKDTLSRNQLRLVIIGSFRLKTADRDRKDSEVLAALKFLSLHNIKISNHCNIQPAKPGF